MMIGGQKGLKELSKAELQQRLGCEQGDVRH